MKQLLAVLAVLLASLNPARADEWPQKSVRIIVPFPAASTPDTVARLLADRLATNLKQAFIVENKPGAGGMIGTDAIAKAAPDGYTFGVSITGPLVNNTLLYKSMSYEPFRDLAPITLAVNQPCVMVANKDFNASGLQEVITELKRTPGKYNYASLGNGTMAHLSMELLAVRSGTQIVQVPYPGSGQAVAALVAGDVSLGCMPAAAVMSLVKAGRLKAIGVASRNRSPVLPDIRTLAEQGLPEVEANAWIGVVAPAATPAPVLARIHAEVVKVLRQPDVREALHAQLMEPVGNSPEQFAAFMREELERWGPIIRRNNIKLD
ncbi:MAG: tripartite tricarboxylate transporter substrate binding protein [Pseudomonadota bacterium]|nr:tripartite tricarboxylate transporter substrate binding protein [Pseudomonadota bacterium]